MTDTVIALVKPLDSLALIYNQKRRLGLEGLRRSLQYFRDCGQVLIRAKAQVGHGHFSTWLAQHCDGSEREARRYMMLAHQWERLTALANRPRVSDLSLREATEHTLAGSGSTFQEAADRETSGPACLPYAGSLADADRTRRRHQ